jgi:hypothetical protein
MTAKKDAKKNAKRKKTRELRRSSTQYARQAADLKQSGRALLRLATQLERESEKALQRSARAKQVAAGRKRRA